jgi:acyl-CoA synthetase (AMP-forming)/AMP-acid ligase II
MAAPEPPPPVPPPPVPAAPEPAAPEPAVPQPAPAAAYESVAAVIRARAAADPAAIAITGDGRQLTFGELDERSSRLASALAGLGVRRGDRVAYLDQNATEFWETMFAAAKLGAVMTPLNFRLAGPELRAILEDAEPTVLIAAAAILDRLDPDAVPTATTLVRVGPGEGAATDYEPLLATGAPADPGEQATGSELAVLMYSSGTTGASKGVCITAENLLTGVATFVAEFAPDTNSRSLVPPPYYHIAASGWSLIALSQGGQVVQVREPRPDHLLNLMQAHATTHAALVPAIIQVMVELPQARTADFSSLRTVVYGASPIDPGLLRRAVDLFQAEFTQTYGLTETVGVATLLCPDDHRSADPARLRSAGRAAACVQLAVTDPATGAMLPAGQTGEVVIRGPNVTPGYWRRPEATAALFRPGGWLRTGDAGHLDADGYLTIADRIKDIIISGGENIIPGEVERVLAEHDGVLEAAVIGVPSPRWGETPVAFVVRRPDRDTGPSQDELLAFCRERLAHYKCPTRVEWVDALPRNPSGKVLRRELRAPYWQHLDRQVG